MEFSANPDIEENEEKEESENSNVKKPVKNRGIQLITGILRKKENSLKKVPLRSAHSRQVSEMNLKSKE